MTAPNDPGDKSRQQRWLREAHHALTKAGICQGHPILWSYGFGHGGTRTNRPYKVYWKAQDATDQIGQDTVFISPKVWIDELSVIRALIAAELHCITLKDANKSTRKAQERSKSIQLMGISKAVLEQRKDDIMRVLLLIDGFPPAPFDMAAKKQTTRMKKWKCTCTVVRCATELDADCRKCNRAFTPDGW